MKSLAVATLCVGEFYNKLAKQSHPALKAYAEKIGADFVVATELETKVPGYTKLNVIARLLEKYERVLFVDTDALVRFDCPNLFEMYPADVVAAFNEEHMFPERRLSKIDFCRLLGVEAPESWLDSKKYFNTGVLLVSREHAHLFEPFDGLDHFGEQTLLNYRIAISGTRVESLPHRFNRLAKTLRLSGECLDDSFIMHFAGCFIGEYRDANYRTWLELANRFKKYRAENKVPEFPRRIYISATGGLGDVISHEPVVRYIREVLDPKADITVRTAFPEVFAHLAEHPRTRIAVTGEKVQDKGHMIIDLLPDPPIANYHHMHAVDYASLAAFKGLLPNDRKRVRLAVNSESWPGIEKYVLVHPGKTWPSRTFPREYWQAIIDGLLEHVPVALIGKTYPPDDIAGRGTVEVDGSRCLDLRNKLSLGELFANVRDAAALVTNDSAPVHIAGAFDKPLIVITTVRKPEFILPHRAARLNIALGRPIKDNSLGVVNHVAVDKCTPDELLAVLPEPREVVAATLFAYGRRPLERGAIPRAIKNVGSGSPGLRCVAPPPR